MNKGALTQDLADDKCGSGSGSFPLRVVCMVRKWIHHTPSGGYDLLAPAVGARAVWRSTTGGIALRVCRRLWKIWSYRSTYPNYYDFEDWLTELRLLTGCLFDRPDVVHVLYGEQHLDLLLRRRSWLRCPLVASFHLPADQLNREFTHFESERIRGIDAAVVVARSQLAEFERFFGPNKVVYVPHGIDTTRFRPSDNEPESDELRLLIVGLWLRDWEVMHRVIDAVRNSQLPVKFDVVTLPPFFPYFTGCSNVTLRSGISETELIELYQKADALFMPLKDATANNAVLEALACGVPVIATDVGGIPDYVTADCGWLIPRGDVESPIELIKQLCADKNIARSRRQSARAQALKFDWRRVAERLFVVYSALCSGRSPAEAIEKFEESLLA